MMIDDQFRGSIKEGRKTTLILGVSIDILNWDQILAQLFFWARQRSSRYICICNVHSITTAYFNPFFSDILNQADLATPDGAPIAWSVTNTTGLKQERINGPDLMWKFCDLLGGPHSIYPKDELNFTPSIYLYGSTSEVLDKLKINLLKNFPHLIISGSYSPPYRDLTIEENDNVVEKINQSRAGLVFISLGCPKQEQWMLLNRGRINSVRVGVGAAFEFHAGTKKRAPQFLQKNGLEWLYRLIQEPRRLWKRYFITNSFFILRWILPLTARKFYYKIISVL